MMYISDELRQAYYLKEAFYTVIDAKSRDEAKLLMSDWILSAQNSCFGVYIVLKRNAYGYHNFERFRKRILHMFSYKNDLAEQGR